MGKDIPLATIIDLTLHIVFVFFSIILPATPSSESDDANTSGGKHDSTWFLDQHDSATKPRTDTQQLERSQGKQKICENSHLKSPKGKLLKF